LQVLPPVGIGDGDHAPVFDDLHVRRGTSRFMVMRMTL
jgi:hypothetical protein